MRGVLIFILMIVYTVGLAQTKVGVYDKNITATDSLETERNFIIASDTIVPILDVSYHEFSVDSVTWTKDDTNANWVRFSNDVKNTWWVLPYGVFTELWEVSNDTLRPKNPVYVVVDSIRAINFVDAPLYQLNGDSLKITHLNASDGSNGQILFTDGTTAYWDGIGSGFGETNVAANVNSRGVGVFEQKVDTALNFRGIASLTELLTVTLASEDSTIDLDLNLKTITAGVGLSGAGSMENDMTINIYIPELLELTSLSTIDKAQDWVAIYDQSAAQHKKIHPRYFHPDVYIEKILDAQNPVYYNFTGINGIEVDGDGTGGVIISSNGAASLPTCEEGQILMYLGGEWTCVNLCDYICSDTIINIINNYNDTVPSVITPSGDVQINFSRLDCEDSTQILASQLATSTLNLTTIKITSIPTVGELHYNGVAVIADQELSVTLGSLDTALYYVSDVYTGSAYIDGFNFQLLYSSNASYLGEANVNVSVDACVSESVCFGYLYNWYAVDDSREITSSADWQVATISVVNSLRSYLGTTVAGGKLKKTGFVYWDSPNIGATNEYDFSMIGSGSRSGSTGLFSGLKSSGNLWMDELNVSSAYTENFSYNSAVATNTSSIKETGYSVRLFKDATGIPDGATTTYTGNDGKTYNAVAINELYWTTENLEETQYRNGDYIPNVTDNTTWANLTTGALCLYDNDANNSCKDEIPVPLTTLEVSTDYTASPDDCSGLVFPAVFDSIDKNTLLSTYLQGTTLTVDDIESIVIVDTSIAVGTDIQYNGSTVLIGDTIDFSNGDIEFIRDATGETTLSSYFTFEFVFPVQWVHVWYPKTAIVKYEATFNACAASFTEIKYGYLYNQYAVNDSRNISNTGWHVPTSAEMATLASTLASTTITADDYGTGNPSFFNYTSESDILRDDVFGWTSTLGSNTSGMSFRGTGYRRYSGEFYSIGVNGYYWTSDINGSVNWGVQLSVGDDSFISDSQRETNGYGVMLIKDSTSLSNGENGTYTGNDGTVYQSICYEGVEYVVGIIETQYRNGDPIPEETVSSNWEDAMFSATGYRCSYNNDESNAY